MMMDSHIEIGGVVYEVCGEIGEGGVGHVFVVKDADNNKFALKVVNEYGRNPIIKQMVDKQIQIQSLFAKDPHIIGLLANKVVFKRMYVVLELGSCSLRNVMAMQAHIDLQAFLRMAVAVCKGVMAIHQRGLIHRDIKPQNIICVDESFKITDFGSLEEGTTASGVIGTPLYLPPEMLHASDYDQAIDIWSLGVSLFQAYFKIHPFYYSKYPKSVKEVYQQLKQNIAILTPQFTIDKLLNHLYQKKDYFFECESIRSKLLITPKQMLCQFQYFFMPAKQRPAIQHFVAVFQSLFEKTQQRQMKKCQLTRNLSMIPSDIQLLIITLNTLYSLCSSYGSKKEQQIEFYLEAATNYLSQTIFKGENFIEYYQKKKIAEQCQQSTQFWEEMNRAIFAYWLEISANKQLAFFEELPIFKVRLLICGATAEINKGSSRFLKIVSSKLDRNIKSMEELNDLLTALSLKDLERIQDSLINKYYKN